MRILYISYSKSNTYLFLFLLFFVLKSLSTFEGDWRFYEPLLVWLVLCLGSFVAIATLKIIFRDTHKANFLLFVSFIFLLFYPFWVHQIRAIPISLVKIGIAPHLLALIILLGTVLGLLIKKKPLSPGLLRYLNVFFLIICVYQITQISWNPKTYKPLFENLSATTSSQDNPPSIYLFLMDGYTNNGVLKKFWNFDNTYFTDLLQDKGFYTTRNSTSNYDYTLFSVSSLLNLQYLPDSSVDSVPLFHSIEENAFGEFLQKHGYRINNLSIFNTLNGSTNQNSEAPVLFGGSNFLHHALIQTVYWTIQRRLVALNKFDRENEIFTSAQKTTKTPSFIYLHSMITHDPHVFSYEKKTISRKINIHYQSPFTDYPVQIQTANHYLIQAVDTLLNRPSNKPIIIILSDHGYKNDNIGTKNSKGKEDIRHQNIIHVYFPDQDYSALYDSITPVNVMRVVLNKAIGTKLPRLPDRNINAVDLK